MHIPLKTALFFIAACALSNWSCAQSVSLSGVLGNKALLVVDGAAPKAVAAGESHMGVKVISVTGQQAVLEIKGLRGPIHLGEAPVSLGAKLGSINGNKIVLPLGSGGHFFTQATIYGKTMQFMVDTGATTVALGMSDAQRLGIDYAKGRPVQMSTANGIAKGWLVKLSSIRIGDVEVYEVDAVVGPNMPVGLLGNSFLNRFSMNRSSDQMVLERRF